MLELAALGLLQREPLHGYRLKQQLELFMSGCISVNYGAIYPLLRRLEKRGAIAILESKDGGTASSRKIYSITAAGKKLWKQKMLSHPQESWVHARSRFTIKFFFFSHLDAPERIELLEHRLMVCRLRLDSKTQEVKLLAGDPYQMEIWQRCQTGIESEMDWLNEQIEREKASWLESSLQR